MDDLLAILEAAELALARGDWSESDRLYAMFEQAEADYLADAPAFVSDEE